MSIDLKFISTFFNSILKFFVLVVAVMSLISCKAADPDSVVLMGTDKTTPTDEIDIYDATAATTGGVPFNFGMIADSSVKYKSIEITNFYSHYINLSFYFPNNVFGINATDCSVQIEPGQTCVLEIVFYHTAPAQYSDFLEIEVRYNVEAMIASHSIPVTAKRLANAN